MDANARAELCGCKNKGGQEGEAGAEEKVVIDGSKRAEVLALLFFTAFHSSSI